MIYSNALYREAKKRMLEHKIQVSKEISDKMTFVFQVLQCKME